MAVIHPKLRTEIVEITEPMAREWLGASAPNRLVGDASTGKRVRAFTERAWRTNGATIVISKTGKLLDGRHRLTGFVAACALDPRLTSFESVVVFGVDDEAIYTIDTGRARSNNDQLRIAGEKSVSVLGACVNKLIWYAFMADRLAPSPNEIIDIVNTHPGVREAVRVCGGVGIVPRSTVAAIYYIGYYIQNEPELADSWVGVFKTGEPAYDGCPAHRLWMSFIKMRERGKVMASSGDRSKQIAHSWNLFKDGKSVQAIKLPNDICLKGWGPQQCFGYGSAAAELAESNRVMRKAITDVNKSVTVEVTVAPRRGRKPKA
jgi:hypothetical protein